MNQLVPIDLAARRSAAALKAWETRRLQGSAPPAHKNAISLHKNAAADALASFEREAASDMPDWHRAALELKRALTAQGKNRVLTPLKPVPALAAPAWSDYSVDHLSAFKIRNPTIVVTFADGEIVRAPAISALNKPLNIGRGLRVAIAFYQARIAWRAALKNRPGFWRAVPAIASCVSETGETFDAEQCTVRTAETRKAQDWRIRR
jgi:hypothetical protein